MESGLCLLAFPSSLTCQICTALSPPSTAQVHPRSWLPAPSALLQHWLEAFKKIYNLCKAKSKGHKRTHGEKSLPVPVPQPPSSLKATTITQLSKNILCSYVSPHKNGSIQPHCAEPGSFCFSDMAWRVPSIQDRSIVLQACMVNYLTGPLRPHIWVVSSLWFLQAVLQ